MTGTAAVSAFEWLRGVRDEGAITGTRLAVLLTAGLFMDGAAGYVSIGQLMESTGLSDGCVRGHIRWARANGWIQQTRRGHRLGDGTVRASEYRLTLPQSAPPRRLTSTGTTAPVDTPQPADDESQPADGGGLNRHPGATPVPLSPVPLSPVAHDPAQRLLIDAGASAEEAREIAASLDADQDVRNPIAYLRAMSSNGDLADYVTRHRTRPRATRPPWCGQCIEETRQIDVGDDRARCPRCHPLAAEAA